MSRKNWTDEKLFFRLENNKSDKTYWENIQELRYRPSLEIFNASVKLIKSRIPKKRIIGINVLAQLGLPPRPFFKESRKLFFDILIKEKDPKVLLPVLYAIGHNNEKLKSDVIALLASFKDNADEGVREGLVSALLSVDNKLAIDALIHLTTDKVSTIRDWATFGIGTQIDRNNKRIREALWLRVDDKDEVTKLEAIVGLAKRKDKRIKQKIQNEILEGENSTLIFEAIQELGDKTFLPFLKKNLSSAKKNDDKNSIWLDKLNEAIQELKKS
jgi:hypothetical protein